MDKEWTTVDILRHSRHDWLNRIQLIKGNLDLNKLERVKAIIDEIVIEAQHEARLSNLRMPKTAELLLTCNWVTRPFKLEYEVLDIKAGCENMDTFLYGWTGALFDVLAVALEPYEDNQLLLSFWENEKKVCFSFELQGKLRNEASLRHYLEQPLQGGQTVIINEFNEQEAIFQLEVGCEI